jgi:hypothetical protein
MKQSKGPSLAAGRMETQECPDVNLERLAHELGFDLPAFQNKQQQAWKALKENQFQSFDPLADFLVYLPKEISDQETHQAIMLQIERYVSLSEQKGPFIAEQKEPLGNILLGHEKENDSPLNETPFKDLLRRQIETIRKERQKMTDLSGNPVSDKVFIDRAEKNRLDYGKEIDPELASSIFHAGSPGNSQKIDTFLFQFQLGKIKFDALRSDGHKEIWTQWCLSHEALLRDPNSETRKVFLQFWNANPSDLSPIPPYLRWFLFDKSMAEISEEFGLKALDIAKDQSVLKEKTQRAVDNLRRKKVLNHESVSSLVADKIEKSDLEDLLYFVMSLNPDKKFLNQIPGILQETMGDKPSINFHSILLGAIPYLFAPRKQQRKQEEWAKSEEWKEQQTTLLPKKETLEPRSHPEFIHRILNVITFNALQEETKQTEQKELSECMAYLLMIGESCPLMQAFFKDINRSRKYWIAFLKAYDVEKNKAIQGFLKIYFGKVPPFIQKIIDPKPEIKKANPIRTESKKVVQFTKKVISTNPNPEAEAEPEKIEAPQIRQNFSQGETIFSLINPEENLLLQVKMGKEGDFITIDRAENGDYDLSPCIDPGKNHNLYFRFYTGGRHKEFKFTISQPIRFRPPKEISNANPPENIPTPESRPISKTATQEKRSIDQKSEIEAALLLDQEAMKSCTINYLHVSNEEVCFWIDTTDDFLGLLSKETKDWVAEEGGLGFAYDVKSRNFKPEIKDGQLRSLFEAMIQSERIKQKDAQEEKALQTLLEKNRPTLRSLIRAAYVLPRNEWEKDAKSYYWDWITKPVHDDFLRNFREKLEKAGLSFNYERPKGQPMQSITLKVQGKSVKITIGETRAENPFTLEFSAGISPNWKRRLENWCLGILMTFALKERGELNENGELPTKKFDRKKENQETMQQYKALISEFNQAQGRVLDGDRIITPASWTDLYESDCALLQNSGYGTNKNVKNLNTENYELIKNNTTWKKYTVLRLWPLLERTNGKVGFNGELGRTFTETILPKISKEDIDEFKNAKSAGEAIKMEFQIDGEPRNFIQYILETWEDLRIPIVITPRIIRSFHEVIGFANAEGIDIVAQNDEEFSCLSSFEPANLRRAENPKSSQS